MKYKVFIGIDVSKLTIDVHLHGIGASKTFSNEEKGFALFLSWVKKHSKHSEPAEMIICFEHTGMLATPRNHSGNSITSQKYSQTSVAAYITKSLGM